jgi:hypothetical protein
MHKSTTCESLIAQWMDNTQLKSLTIATRLRRTEKQRKGNSALKTCRIFAMPPPTAPVLCHEKHYKKEDEITALERTKKKAMIQRAKKRRRELRNSAGRVEREKKADLDGNGNILGRKKRPEEEVYRKREKKKVWRDVRRSGSCEHECNRPGRRGEAERPGQKDTDGNCGCSDALQRLVAQDSSGETETAETAKQKENKRRAASIR